MPAFKPATPLQPLQVMRTERLYSFFLNIGVAGILLHFLTGSYFPMNLCINVFGTSNSKHYKGYGKRSVMSELGPGYDLKLPTKNDCSIPSWR